MQCLNVSLYNLTYFSGLFVYPLLLFRNLQAFLFGLLVLSSLSINSQLPLTSIVSRCYSCSTLWETGSCKIHSRSCQTHVVSLSLIDLSDSFWESLYKYHDMCQSLALGPPRSCVSHHNPPRHDTLTLE